MMVKTCSSKDAEQPIFSFRWWAAILDEMSARHAEMLGRKALVECHQHSSDKRGVGWQGLDLVVDCAAPRSGRMKVCLI